MRTDSASLRFFRQRIASFLSPRTDSASLRLVAEAIAVRDTRALVRSRSSVACVRAGDYAGNLTNWRENTRCAARPPASGATRPRRSRPAMQAGTATSRRRRCRLRPTFKGVMRCRMESPSDEAMRCRFAIGANRQRIASFFPTAHRFVFVASDRQRIASIGGRGNCCSRHSGARSLPFLRCLRPCR